jgi:hypothetical protein
VQQRGVLVKSAIVIEAGVGKEDRMMNGSYAELRSNESQVRNRAENKSDFYAPGADDSDEEAAPHVDSDPFGLHGT